MYSKIRVYVALESRVWDVSMILYDPHAAIIVESPCHRWPFMLQLIHKKDHTFLYMDILIWRYIETQMLNHLPYLMNLMICPLTSYWCYWDYLVVYRILNWLISLAIHCFLNLMLALFPERERNNDAPRFNCRFI